MQNYFRTLYFTISSKTTAVAYAIPFYKRQRREGSLHFFRLCRIIIQLSWVAKWILSNLVIVDFLNMMYTLRRLLNSALGPDRLWMLRKIAACYFLLHDQGIYFIATLPSRIGGLCFCYTFWNMYENTYHNFHLIWKNYKRKHQKITSYV